MGKLTRITGKVFGETATATGSNPEIGQFGSALAGTYNGTTDVATIQSLAAWSNGFIGAVTPTNQYPPLPEMTGFGKVLSHQTSYLLQQGIAEWDSATDYYTNNFCSKNGKVYTSLTDNNLNNDPESDTLNWQEFSSGTSRNIGEIVTSTIPLTDAGLHLLDGSLLAYGSYQAFIDYIADLYDSGDYSDIFETEANWQTAVTTYGVCGKFVYDSVNNTVRLPKYSNKIYTQDISSSAPVIGNGIALGLTNGTNNSGFIYGTTIGMSGGDGAYGANVGSGWPGSSSPTWSNLDAIGVTTNPTNSGLIAQLSDITTSLDGYYYIVIATTTKTQIQVDIDQIATDLNGKADTDLTNVNNSGTSRGAQWAMPSDTYEDLTLGASGSVYVAPADGWYSLRRQATANDAQIHLYTLDLAETSKLLESYTYAPVNTNWIAMYIPVRKNQSVVITYANITASSGSQFKFIYAQGSEWEA